MKWVVICAFGMLMFASGQVVSQKLLASDEAGSFLEAGAITEEELYARICENEGCEPSMKGNGVCDQDCRSMYCRYDAGDCAQYEGCSEGGCTLEMIGNGRCDPSCNIKECEYDKTDCINIYYY
jgi:hypothetical protein